LEKIETKLQSIEQQINKFSEERGKLTSQVDTLKHDLSQREVMFYLKHEKECFIRYKTRECSTSVLSLIKHELRVF
jgi:hypothetical protein